MPTWAGPTSPMQILGASTLTNANLSGAVVTGASFDGTTLVGFRKEQLYSTASYQQGNLRGIGLGTYNDLSGWDLSGQNLTGAALSRSTLTNASLTGAVVLGAGFYDTTSRGFTKAQLYSTASYHAKDLQGIGLGSNDLAGWDFSGQDLTGANFSLSTFTNANLTGAVVTAASFDGTTSSGFTKEQLYSTASYKNKELPRIGLNGNDLTGWDFSGQNLTGAVLGGSVLTNVNLTGAVVTGANFEHHYRGQDNGGGLTQAQLASTTSYKSKDLQGINLWGNNLTGMDLSGQNLMGAIFDEDWDAPGRSNLTNVNLTGANLTGSILSETTLDNADMSGANLTNAKLARGADNRSKSFEHHGTGLYQGTGLRHCQLSSKGHARGRARRQRLRWLESLWTKSDASAIWRLNVDEHQLKQRQPERFAILESCWGSGRRILNRYPGTTGGREFRRRHDRWCGLQLYRSDQGPALLNCQLQIQRPAGRWPCGSQSHRCNARGSEPIGCAISYTDVPWPSRRRQPGQRRSPRSQSCRPDLAESILTGADIADAVVTGAGFGSTNLTREQLFSTASYKAKDMNGIGLSDLDLSGYDFSGQNLTGASFSNANLVNVNLADAVINAADFTSATFRGLVKEQLYSTASYKEHSLQGINLSYNSLSHWNLEGQNLAGAALHPHLARGCKSDRSRSDRSDIHCRGFQYQSHEGAALLHLELHGEKLAGG